MLINTSKLRLQDLMIIGHLYKVSIKDFWRKIFFSFGKWRNYYNEFSISCQRESIKKILRLQAELLFTSYRMSLSL